MALRRGVRCRLLDGGQTQVGWCLLGADWLHPSQQENVRRLGKIDMMRPYVRTPPLLMAVAAAFSYFRPSGPLSASSGPLFDVLCGSFRS